MRAADARPGDVLLAADGQVYQAPAAEGTQGWSHMQMMLFFGDPAATAPDGELVLLARDGRPAAGPREETEVR